MHLQVTKFLPSQNRLIDSLYTTSGQVVGVATTISILEYSIKSEYFSKIFALLSKDLRKQILDLKISKKEKRELLQELAFLTKEEKVKYIDAIVSLYREIPKKLINRIRKLPNVKPKHYDKIIEQLKYMNVEEQIKFVQFLEENA